MRIFFLGTGGIGLPALQHLLERTDCSVVAVITQPDKPVGRKRIMTASPIKTAALASGIPVFQPARIRDPAMLTEIASWRPDLGVCMAYGQILPGSLLAIPLHGCINLHASLLPRHRGAAPIQAAIADGDAETGISVMRMEEGLDTGPVLLQHRIPIGVDETAGHLHDRLATVAAAALRESLDLLLRGPVEWHPQEEVLATHAPKLSVATAQIDWHQPAATITRHIRAMDPWPGAWTLLASCERGSSGPSSATKIKIHRAVAEPQSSEAHATGEGQPPGTVLSAMADGIRVATGAGVLRLLRMQLENRKPMEVRDFLNGHPLSPGYCFLSRLPG